MAVIVVKLGGDMLGESRLPSLAGDIAALAAEHRVAVVHGGGPQATAECERLGIAPRMVAGRRATDEATLAVMKRVLAELNGALCDALAAAGATPLPFVDGAVRARRRPPRVYAGAGEQPIDLGLVGDVVGFRLADWPRGQVPVLASLGSDEAGAVYNINADVVANQLAIALDADLLALVTAVDGVRRDVRDPATRIARLTVEEGRAAIARGEVTGGMIPKLEESFAALAAGVKSILIVGGDLARAVRQPGSAGTLLVSSI